MDELTNEQSNKEASIRPNEKRMERSKSMSRNTGYTITNILSLPRGIEPKTFKIKF